MKHIRSITLAKANASFDPYLLELLLSELYIRLLDFVFYNILGVPEREPDSKEA